MALARPKYGACHLGSERDACPHPRWCTRSGCQDVHPSAPAPVVFRCRSLRRAGRSLQSCFSNRLLSPRCRDLLCPSQAMGLWDMGRHGTPVPGRVGGGSRRSVWGVLLLKAFRAVVLGRALDPRSPSSRFAVNTADSRQNWTVPSRCLGCLAKVQQLGGPRRVSKGSDRWRRSRWGRSSELATSLGVCPCSVWGRGRLLG